MFNGPPPTVHSLTNEGEETETVAHWIAEQAKAGLSPREFGVSSAVALLCHRGRR